MDDLECDLLPVVLEHFLAFELAIVNNVSACKAWMGFLLKHLHSETGGPGDSSWATQA